MTTEPNRVFKIQLEATANYFRWTTAIMLVVCGIWFFGAGLVAAILYLAFWGSTLPRRQAEAVSYRLEGGMLRVDSGLYFLKRKSIPLDRVTDFMLSQGPLMRRAGIWSLHVQTAGTGTAGAMAEAVLYGLENPEQVRDELLRARDAAVARGRA